MSSTPPTVSPRCSFSGFSPGTYVAKNKGGIKLAFGALVTLLTEYVAPIKDPNLNHLLSLLLGLASRFGADLLDYWISVVATTPTLALDPASVPLPTVSPSAVADALKRQGS